MGILGFVDNYHYMIVVLDVDEYKKTQHTPNPEAHPPLAEPPLLEHSDSEKQVPFLLVDCPVDKVDVEMQGSFLNCITLNNENIFPLRLSGCSLAKIMLALKRSKIIVAL